MACALAIGLAAQASALVTQKVTVILEDELGNQIAGDSDEVMAQIGDPIPNPIFASISGNTFNSAGSVGVFGQLGVEAQMIRTGRMVNQVIIFSDEIVNLTGIDQHAVANFIIDGGDMAFFGGIGSTAELQLNLERRVLVGNTQVGFTERWQGGFDLESVDDGNGNPVNMFTPFGNDIHATFDGDSNVDIDFSFQSFDMGIIPANGRIELEYFLHIEGDMSGFAEVLAWNFSDPLSISQTGDRPQPGFEQTPTFSVVLSPVDGGGGNGGAIPEPITAALGLMGLGALAATTRRRAV